MNFRYKSGLVTVFILFIVFFFLSYSIKFYQNDDWVYYLNIQNFLNGNFALNPLTAPTFYTQGILGAVFSMIFGITNLPILTLLVSVGNFFLVYIIAIRYFNKSQLISILSGLLFFFNPLHFYSAMGFMSENYLIFFLLISLAFLLEYTTNFKPKNLVLFNIFMVLTFFVKQSAFPLFIASAIYLVVLKKYKESLVTVAISFITLATYYFLFPLTEEMISKPVQFYKLVDINYQVSIMYAGLIVFSAFSLPLILSHFFSLSKRSMVISVLISILVFIGLEKFFEPQIMSNYSSPEFPYFENILSMKGFYIGSLHGTKYSHMFWYDLYFVWEIAAKFIAGLLVGITAVKLKFIKQSPELILFGSAALGCILLATLATAFYDRYLLPTFVLMSLFLIRDLKENAINKIMIAGFTLVMAVYSIQFGVDFVLTNKYIWTKSNEILQTVNHKKISSTKTWNKYNDVINPLPQESFKYLFSYDSPEVFLENNDFYKLEDAYKPSYKPNIFINPGIYLYSSQE